MGMSGRGSWVLVLLRDSKPPLAWREGSTGVSEGGSRVLELQRDNFPLAWLEGSTGMTGRGSQVLVQQQDNRQLAWQEGSTGVSEAGSWVLVPFIFSYFSEGGAIRPHRIFPASGTYSIGSGSFR